MQEKKRNLKPFTEDLEVSRKTFSVFKRLNFIV